MNNLYSTVDSGRTHIAYGDHYLGSVNSYNNFFTKAYAWLFRKASHRTVHGKMRWIETKSYNQFLKNLGFQGTQAAQERSLEAIIGRIHIPTDRGLMIQNLQTKKTERLTQKLIHAMIANNHNKAEKYVGQGADVNHYFWVREGFKGPLNSFDEKLPLAKIKTTATQYTPLLFAAKNKSPLHEFMNKVLLGQSRSGMIVKVKRDLTRTGIKHRVRHGIKAQPIRGRGRDTMVILPTTEVTNSVYVYYYDTAYKTHDIHIRDGLYLASKLDAPEQILDKKGQAKIHEDTYSRHSGRGYIGRPRHNVDRGL